MRKSIKPRRRLDLTPATTKAATDNRSVQLNPQDPTYHKDRGATPTAAAAAAAALALSNYKK